MTATLDSHIAACAEIVRRHDRERYLVSLFAGPRDRAGLFAILAANHEIAKTAEVVSEPTIGLIRLQWWREAFDGIEAGAPRAHEVVLPLTAVAARHPEVLDDLRRVVDVREADLAGEPAADIEDLVAYAVATGGGVLTAMARVLGADPAASRDLGTGWALIGLARAVPTLIAAGRSPLPASLLEENALTVSKIKDLPGSVDLSPLCRPIVERGLQHVSAAVEAGRLKSHQARPLRLLAERARDIGSDLLRRGGDPRSLPPRPAPPGLVWRYALRSAIWRLGL